MAVHDPKTLDDLLNAVKAERAALPEPSFEALETYARGGAEPVERAEIARVIDARPELSAIVDAMREPEPRLSMAIRRGLAEGRRRRNRLGAALRWLSLPLTAVAAALVLWTVGRVSPEGDVMIAPDSFAWVHGVRSGEGTMTRHRAGDRVPFTLTPPAGSVQAVLLEVSGRQVDPIHTFDVQAGARIDSALTLSGDATPGFLVVVYLERPVPSDVLASDLAAAASTGTLLAEQDPPTRQARIARALRRSGRPRMWIDLSDLFQVVP